MLNEFHGFLTPLLEARAISKSFPGVQALDCVDFAVYSGEIHAIVGVNGAGKSTLIKIMSGVYQPDRGSLVLRGQPVVLRSVAQALKLGIAVVYQERTLIPHLTVAQNILLGEEPVHAGILNERRVRQIAEDLVRQFEVHLPLDCEVRLLGAGQRQLTDILRLFRHKPSVMILDEPTAALSLVEVEHLFTLLKRFKQEDIGIIYVSHRVDEVFALADRITVLRDGRVVYSARREHTTPREVIQQIANRDIEMITPLRSDRVEEQGLLEVQELSGSGFKRCTLNVHVGEVVGLAGAVGSGRTALLETISGVRRTAGGTIRLHGQPVNLRSPLQALQRGIVLVPEKRIEKGIIERLTVMENLTLPSLKRLARFAIVLSRRREIEAAAKIIAILRIATPSIWTQVKYLSGGNKQKVSFGKWLLTFGDVYGKLFLFDEPTEGVDVGVKAEMWQIIHDLARRGAGIIVASSELEELFHLANRIYVLRDGRIVAEEQTSNLSADRLLALMLGDLGASDAA